MSDATDDGVGARIFQTSKSKTELPQSFAYWRSTLLDKNPAFAFTWWDDDDNRRFIAAQFPWFLEFYDRLPAGIYRADCIRYFYLYTHGGFYIDMDTEGLKPLDKFVGVKGILFGRMGTDAKFAHAIGNAIMASRPREEFWLFLIGLIRFLYGLGLRGPEALTGPIALRSAVDIYLSEEPLLATGIIKSLAKLLPAQLQPRPARSKIELLPQREWYPLDWSDQVHTPLRKAVLGGKLLTEQEKAELFPESTLVTYFSHSWTA
jgi:mannosyltransferase OCH1-like enzyme